MGNRSKATRNVALVGHGNAGKTTFAEHALHRAGVTSRAGSVTEGSTVSDAEQDEKDRGHSIDPAVLHLPWNGQELQLIDCPGYPDFAGVATEAMSAADTVVVFVNATSGVGVNTRRMWSAATEMRKQRVVVVSRLDDDNADPEKALSQIQDQLSARCLPYNLPEGAGTDFKSLIPCFGPDGAGEGDTLCGDPDSAREEFLEAVVEADDELLERYLGGDEISDEELVTAFRAGMKRGIVIPVLFVSTAKDKGMRQLLDFLATYATTGGNPMNLETAEGEEVHAEGPFAATVFKVTSDVHVGKLAFLRCWRGSLPSDGVVWNSATDGTVKITHPSRPQGKELLEVSKVEAGDIVCVAKIEDLKIGATLTDPGTRVRLKQPTLPEPMVHMAVTPKARGDEHKISNALGKLSDEDPCFTAERDRETAELIVSGLSSLHLDLLLKRLDARFHVGVDTHLPRVPLKETVNASADCHYRHKKQTGGRGQFGEVYLRIRPNDRGEGFTFANKTVGGSIPTNFIPAVEKGIREAMQTGVYAGYPVVDVCVEVYDGKHHPVDSSEAAFKLAGSKAFRDGFMTAKPVLLEPIMDIEIDVPSTNMGDVSGDLNTRRGRIMGMDARGDHQIVKAQVPLSEVQTYSTDLRSMTSGEGTYTLTFSHLDIVPSNVANKIAAKFERGGDD